MKKIFALLALVLGVVSCQTEPEGLDVNVGGEQEVAICVTIPETETRAGGLNSALGVFNNGILDGDATMRYILQVYYKTTENGEVKYTASKERLVKYSDGKSVTFPVRLVPNRNYQFVVWADVVDGENAGDKHYNTADLANVQLNRTWVAMDETRDAFTATQLVENYNSTSSINITLKRPFAKLRVVTTDMVALNNLGIQPKNATVTYSVDHYNAFNALAGNAIGDSKNRTIKHENFVIASYNENVAAGANMTLFTDYFFAEAGDVVKFELNVFDQNGVSIKKNNFNTDISVQRNYLTTIAGNILTDGNNVTVTVEDTFANYDENGDLINPDYEYATISSEAELLAAIDNGGEYIVISDIEVNGLSISAQAATRSGVTTTINLNGKTITLWKDIEVEAGNTLIINNDPVDDAGNDEGAIVSENGKAIINNGTLNIEGGNFGENTIVNNGSANVSGGNFEDNAIVNNGSVSVEGDNSGDEDRIIENDGTNAVVSNIVYTDEELQAALDEGKVDEIIFGADLVGEATISQREGVNVYINGAGKKFDGTIKIYGNSRYTGAETILIENVNFETETSKDFIWSDNGQVSEMRYAHNITVKGCTFTGVEGQAIVGMRLRQAYNVIVEDCQASNVHSLVQNASAHGLKIKNVRVNGLTGINIPSSGNVEITNSTIIASEENGFAVRGDGSNPGSMKISGCTFLADRPVIVRNLKSTYNLAFEGTNHLNNNKTYHVILTNGKDDEAYVAPTGTYTLTGADDFIVFPYTWEVTNGDELVAALDYNNSKTKTVIFKNDIEMSANQSNAYGKTGINILNGQTLDGAGHTFKVKNAGGTWDTAISTTGGTIKNLTVTQGFRGIFVNHNGTHSEKVILNNVVINGPTYTLSCDQGTYQGLEATNCTFNGWTSYAKTIGEIKFNNCYFGKGAGYKTCVPYRPTTFTNCEFCENFDMYSGEYATLINCTSNGVALTPANAYSGFADAKFMNAEGKESVLVSNNEQFAAAAANVNVETIYLSSGKHTIELYTNAVPRESLTIIGTEGTQIEFGNQQVRMALFRNFTIENCEILHMATKSWGMLVFGGGDKADGVYTVKNCTFNGVGTQGIYINEDVSGATYNVLGCTFNGGFGSEGAVTIQNNTDVNFTVNVTGCTFNNVNDNNKIYLIGNYRGWTLNTDLAENEVNWSGSNPNI